MNNFKVLMNGIVKENPTFVLLLGMCPTGNHFFGHQWYGYGIGNHVCVDLFECSNFVYQESDS